jgi:hypothetical protein
MIQFKKKIVQFTGWGLKLFFYSDIVFEILSS